MADPGMFSAADQRLTEGGEAGPDLGGIPRQPAGVALGASAGDRGEGTVLADAGGYTGAGAHAPAAAENGAPATGRRLPLVAAVLLADGVLALVALIAFVVIGLQRLDGATLGDRRTAHAEDLMVFFAVGAVFALVAYLLRRTGQAKAALVQLAVALAAFGLGGYAAAAGSPSQDSVVSPIVPEESPSPLPPSAS